MFPGGESARAARLAAARTRFAANVDAPSVEDDVGLRQSGGFANQVIALEHDFPASMMFFHVAVGVEVEVAPQIAKNTSVGLGVVSSGTTSVCTDPAGS